MTRSQTNDILKGIEVMLTGKITMLEITQQFEYEFAKIYWKKVCVNGKFRFFRKPNLRVCFS